MNGYNQLMMSVVLVLFTLLLGLGALAAAAACLSAQRGISRHAENAITATPTE